VIQAQGDYAGSVAVINGATCNGTNTSGCSQIPLTVPAGYGASQAAIDPIPHTAYTTNTEHATLSAIDGFFCNRIINFGCNIVSPKLAAGDYPSFRPGTIAIDPAEGTAYVDSLEGPSVIPLRP
jgi:DNA-binding beta-propeller fold protein YncE